MTSTQSEYKKVKGSSHGLLSEYSIYHSDSQIIIVDAGLVREKYRKVAYSDICGFCISETSRATIIGFLFLFIGAGFLIGSIATKFNEPILWILSAIGGTFLAVNIIKGKSCKCVLSTVYSSIPLPSLKRIKRAKRFKAFLDEKIEPIQGTLTHADLIRIEEERNEVKKTNKGPETAFLSKEETETLAPVDIDKLDSFSAESVPPISTALNAPPPLPAGTGPSTRHSIFPITAAILSVSCVLSIVFAGYPTPISTLLYVAAFIAATLAASKKIETEGGSTVVAIAKWAIAIYMVNGIIGYIMLISSSMYNVQPYRPDEVSNLVMTKSPTAIALLGINAIINAILAFLYYMALRKTQRRERE